MVVYVIVCSESAKLYIGQHKHEERLKQYLASKFWDAHRATTRRSHLYNAMRKHSRETWSIWPLVSGIETRAELDELEKQFIRVLKAQHPAIGYNICQGGEGFSSEQMQGNTHGRGNKGNSHPKDEEFRRRVSATLKGRPKSQEHAQHIGDGHRGLHYHYTEDSHNRLRTMAGKTHSEEWKQKARERMTGFTHSDEAKQKMRHPKSPETIQRMIAAQQLRQAKEK